MKQRPWRVGFYYTHYQCLGHTTRIRTLSQAVKQKWPESRVYCIEGSREQGFLNPDPCCTHLTLPLPLFSRENFISQYVFNSGAAEKRGKACLELVRSIDPDLFITEYFPLGRYSCRHELLPSLMHLSRKGAALCSCAGYPVIPDESMAGLPFFSRLYRRIFIHAPAIEAEYVSRTYQGALARRRYLDIFKRYADTIIFTNYLLPVELSLREGGDEAPAVPKGKVSVLVSRGAGAYAPRIIEAAIQASDLAGEEFFFTIVAGPSTTRQEWARFTAAFKRKRLCNAALLPAASRLPHLMRGSDVCVGPSPYHTSVWLLYYRKKAVVIPFEGSRQLPYREQKARAGLLHDFLGAPVLSYDRLTPKQLAAAVMKTAAGQGPLRPGRIPPAWFQGKQAFLKEVGTFYRGVNRGSGRK